VKIVSGEKTERSPSLKPLTEEQKLKSYWGEIAMGILAKTPEAITLFEVFHMTREIYSMSKETAREQLRLKYCLYSVLVVIMALSAVLLGVFYSIGMSAIGLSFLGPLVTGIIGLIVVLVSGRK
jgi:Na+/H+ antiporter NhaC